MMSRDKIVLLSAIAFFLVGILCVWFNSHMSAKIAICSGIAYLIFWPFFIPNDECEDKDV